MSVAAVQGLDHPPPIIFVGVTDPAGAGFVDTLARPGGNATGFMLFEYGFTAKWLELLKQIRPNTKRAAVLRLVDEPYIAKVAADLTTKLAQIETAQTKAAETGVQK